MQRYFTKKIMKSEKKALLSSNDFHHIKNVMRLNIDDIVVVCDLNESCYTASIGVFLEDTKEVLLTLIDELVSNELPLRVDLAQALIRRERFEYVLQKTTELGVHDIIPVQSKYSIVKINNNELKKLERWNKITKEASEQSHRSHLVQVEEIKNSFKQLDYHLYDQVLVAYEKEHHSKQLKDVFTKKAQNILLVIGPEGGLHPDEISFFETLENVTLVGLGKRILRSETASSYLLSVISYHYEIGDLS